LYGFTQVALAKERGVLYILLPSETEAGSAGEQPARDSWVTVIKPSSRREGLHRLPAFCFWFNHCPMPKKTQTGSVLQQLFRLFRNPPWFS
jgi:hypothetical protein